MLPNPEDLSTDASELDPDEIELARAIMVAGRAVMNAGTAETHIHTALVPTDTDPLVRLQFSTDTGVFVVAISQDVARKLGVDLQQKGSRKKLAVIGGK